MREKQLIQLLQFIFVWVLIWFFVTFVLENSFVDFLLKYWLYFLIVSISYFYYYSIQYDLDKKSKLIRNFIIYGNLYLFAHVFFRPLLNISHQLFILLWLIILWMWWTTKLTTRWKYLMQLLWCIFWFFILISWVFYLYPNGPDVEWFIKSRIYKISAFWVDEQVSKKDAYIQIVDSRKVSDFDIVSNFERQISENCKISYPSKKVERHENIVILTPYWEVIWLFPQSEIELEFDGENMIKLSQLNWNIWFLSWVFDSSVDFSWGMDLSLEQQNWIQWVQYNYKYDFITYLKDQISDNNISLVNSTIMYNIDWKILRLLARMFPASFGKNLRNYNEFQNYFSWIDEKETVSLNRYTEKKESWWSFSSFWDNLVNNMKIWKRNAYNVFKKH